MPITLKNEARQSQTFNLAHESLRDAGPPFGYRPVSGAVVDENARTGARHPRATRKMLPAVLTLLAGETRAGLPTAVKLCPEVRAALAARALRVVAEIPDEPDPGATKASSRASGKLSGPA